MKQSHKVYVFNTLGERLQFLRGVSGLTVRAAAERMRKSTSSLQNWELNKIKPRVENLELLANFYRAPLSWITKDDQPYVEEQIELSSVHSLGERIRFIRQLEALTIQEMAYLLQVTPVQIALAETGHGRPLGYTKPIYYRLAEYFGVYYDFLLMPELSIYHVCQIEGNRVAVYRQGLLMSQSDFAARMELPVETIQFIETGRFPLTNRLREKISGILDRPFEFFVANTPLVRDKINRISEPLDRVLARMFLDIYEFHDNFDPEQMGHIFELSLFEEEMTQPENVKNEANKYHLIAMKICAVVLKRATPQKRNNEGIDFSDMIHCYLQIKSGDIEVEEFDEETQTAILLASLDKLLERNSHK